jgi:hypothetical protein
MKTKHISNPLTVMAVFVSLAEVSGSAILPILTDDIQSIFLWFVMLFPILIVSLFFATLNWNHKVLYAPTDFRDDKSFLDLIRPLNDAELVIKRDEQIIEETEVKEPEADKAEDKEPITEEPLNVHKTTQASPPILETTVKPSAKLGYSFQAKAREAEALAIQEIQKEYPFPFTREVSFENVGFFDALAFDTDRKQVIVVEVKYLKSGHFNADIIHKLLYQSEALRTAASKNNFKSKFILAIVISEEANENHVKAIKKRVNEITKHSSQEIDLRVFEIEELKKK